MLLHMDRDRRQARTSERPSRLTPSATPSCPTVILLQVRRTGPCEVKSTYCLYAECMLEGNCIRLPALPKLHSGVATALRPTRVQDVLLLEACKTPAFPVRCPAQPKLKREGVCGGAPDPI
jgi:hypothetical protein